MSELVPRVGWELAGEGGGAQVALDVRLLPLLRAIAARGSLSAAARDAGVPYRSAWAVIEEAHATVRTALVVATRGRGAVLTPLAQRLLDADARAGAALKARARAVPVPLPEGAAKPRTRPLVVAASHDLALAQLRDAWRVHHGIALEFHGSEESIAAFAAGRADVAGFHVPERAGAADPLIARLSPARDVRIRFLRREQGLIVPAGNPQRVRSLRDLVAKRVPFVNRQPGSGTRLLLDRLIARERIAPGDVVGYTTEEFTHAAVAATVAAGNAGAGFGVRAAAAQLGLGFVPLARERYFFACRRRALETEALRGFRALLASAATRAVVTPLPGYALDAPGEADELPASNQGGRSG